ncbi:DUF6088 family protein [Youngiibacter multivorans]|uniref:Type IV toxin-antitoxin system AbiEi family antitoxin domain-containing protein n=1 Tax=Youngiibacter multivorans TaxID=937251 RepID=A0ABS4FZW7_9CLOT|nr:DUF6088 family protein [Youngiibacter multivorans]MBP1917853.1 hypothetical protein [Youngiibacter multivorans]
MIRVEHLALIRKRILESEKGTIFVTSDFKDISERNAIKMSLSRLSNEGLIRRIARGLYEYPEYSEFLQQFVSPSPNKFAYAIARNFGWTIIPYGDTALNILGLSTQVPNIWSFVSDGPYKKYELNNIIIEFKHTTNKEITGLSYITALIIQALKALGKENISKSTIYRLHDRLTSDEKRLILSEAKYATSWIYEAMKQIMSQGDVYA